MSHDKRGQGLIRVLEELGKLKTTYENNLDLVIKRSKEFREQSLEVLRRELEPTFRARYAEAVRDVNVALSLAVEKNRVVLDIFNAAQRLFGQNQIVIHQLTWKELLIDSQAESKLQAPRRASPLDSLISS